jgi:Uma2 family endonuclease
MVVAIARPSIEEQLKALPPDTLYEVVDGSVREKPRMGMFAGSVANYLAIFINVYAYPLKLGAAFVEAMYRFRDDLPQRRPDLSFISADQWPGVLTGDSDPPSLHLVPSLAVEVISPTNSAAEIEEKRLEYFQAGILAVWVVHPLQRTIHVYTSPSECRVLSLADTLDGGKVIPGFHVKMADLFAAVTPPKPTTPNGTH